MTKFEKNFYREDARVTARSEREIDEFRRLKEIKVRYCVLVSKAHLAKILADSAKGLGFRAQSLVSRNPDFRTTF